MHDAAGTAMHVRLPTNEYARPIGCGKQSSNYRRRVAGGLSDFQFVWRRFKCIDHGKSESCDFVRNTTANLTTTISVRSGHKWPGVWSISANTRSGTVYQRDVEDYRKRWMHDWLAMCAKWYRYGHRCRRADGPAFVRTKNGRRRHANRIFVFMWKRHCQCRHRV